MKVEIVKCGIVGAYFYVDGGSEVVVENSYKLYNGVSEKTLIYPSGKELLEEIERAVS